MNEVLLAAAAGGTITGWLMYAFGLRGDVNDHEAHATRCVAQWFFMFGVAAFFLAELLK